MAKQPDNVFDIGGDNPFKGATTKKLITLQQNKQDSFNVVYGLDVKSNLDYNEAATELGACIMHWLACDGSLDSGGG